jgi:DinB superfamily
LELIRRETEIATRGMTPDAWLRAPKGKWNSLQILEHLVLTYTATTKGLLRTMEAGEPQRGRPDLRQRMRCLYVLRIGRFPAGVEAPQHTAPLKGLGDDPLRLFNNALVAMDATLSDAEKRFGGRTRLLNHPVLGPLTAQAWRRFHQVHGRHHLKQVVTRVHGRD